MIIHEPATLYSGDVWELRGTLLDAAGNVLDITDFSFEWRLIDPLGTIRLDEADVAIVKTDAPGGKLTITVPYALTRELEPAHYTDALRTKSGTEGPAIMWLGSIFVEQNYFLIDPVLLATEYADACEMTGTVA